MKLRRILKWTSIGLGAVVLLSVMAVVGLVASEWTFIQRVRHFPAQPILDVAWYTPKVTVRGGEGAPLPRAQAGEIRGGAKVSGTVSGYTIKVPDTFVPLTPLLRP